MTDATAHTRSHMPTSPDCPPDRPPDSAHSAKRHDAPARAGATKPAKPPLVYACSGCSSAAQMANHLALELDATGHAEMSCIAGIGGKVPTLLRIAHSGRPILALDGCVLACVRETLAQEHIVPTRHVRLDLLGVRKLKRTRFDAEQARSLFVRVVDELSTLEHGRNDGETQAEPSAAAQRKA